MDSTSDITNTRRAAAVQADIKRRAQNNSTKSEFIRLKAKSIASGVNFQTAWAQCMRSVEGRQDNSREAVEKMEAAFERHSTCLMEVLTVYCDREDDSGITEVNAEIEAAEKKYREANERYLDELAEERYSRSSGSRSVHSVRSQVRGRVETAVSGRNPRQSVGAASRINSDSNKWR